MQLPGDFSAAQAARLRPGFVLRPRNRVAASLQAVTSLVHFDWLSANSRLLFVSVVLAAIACGGILVHYFSSRASMRSETGKESPYWDRISQVDLKNLVTIGKNRFFNLEPGYRLRYTSGEATRTMTVRRKTKVIDGIETRVVEEKEEEYNQPTKVVWRYYALDKTTSALYCFGVHSQTYCNGRLIGNQGWRSGAHAAMFTLVLPADPQVGDILVRNHRPDTPRRREEVIDIAAKVVTPAGTFTNCVCTETKGRRENKVKVFAPGVGLVQDGPFALVKTAQTVAKNKTLLGAD